ncbi:MAG: hypothetical protein ACHQM6_05860 [Candidatus Kapaibacterium sp.]
MTKSLLFKILLSLILGTWICNVSIAQETTEGRHPITKSGSLALEFDFGGLNSMSMPGVLIASFLFPGEGTTDAIPLYGAGVKYYLSDGLALRGMVGFSTNTSGADSLSSGKITGTMYGIGAGIEMHTHPVYAVSPYFGAQVIFASGSSETSKTIVEKAGGKASTQATTTTDTKLAATGFGVGIMAGFDWYVFDAVAIGGEYELSFATVSASSTTNGTKSDAPSSSAFGIGSANVHLIIHL